MTVVDDKAIRKYLQLVINKIFKILPLYEENNETLEVYIESLILEVKGFIAVYGSVGVTEYISVVSTLEGIQKKVQEEGNQPTVKREVFKTIDTVNKIRHMLEGD